MIEQRSEERTLLDRVELELALLEAERRHREVAARLDSVVSNLKEIVFQTDAAGLWSFLNPAWTEVTGFSVAESLGQNFLDYVHPDDRERNNRLFLPLIQRKKEYCRHDVRYLTRAGGSRWIEVHARLTLDDQDRIVGTSGTLRDVTAARQMQEQLVYREEFERLMMNLSADFVSRSSEQVDPAIDGALAAIGRFTGVDRAYVFRLDESCSCMSNTHEWCGEGISCQKENLQNLPCDVVPAWMSQMRRFEALYVPEVAELGEGWREEREILQAQDIRSVVVVPVVHSESLLGFAGFDSVRAPRSWTRDEIGLLKLFGELLANALHRREGEEKLAAANRQLAEEKHNLELFQQAAVDQELIAIGLKREVNELCARLGKPARYAEVEEIERLLAGHDDMEQRR